MAATKSKLKEAAKATSVMFEGSKEQPKKATAKKTAPPKEEKKKDLQTFSVKVDSEVLKKWRAYTSIGEYGQVGKLTEKAIDEYMNKHKLVGDDLVKFNKLMDL